MNSEEAIYISLQEAAQCCNYSQEYLSLRARQGKLRALKFGRNWVTKKEWLEEYLREVEEYNNNLKIRTIVAPAFVKTTAGKPPENLPVELPAQHADLRRYQRGFRLKEFFKISQPRFALIIGLVFVSLITGIFHGRESFKITYETLTPLVIELNENFNKEIVNTVQMVGGAGDVIVEPPTEIIFETVSTIPQSFKFVFGEINYQLATLSYQAAGIGEIATKTLKGYSQRLAKSYLTANDFLEKGIREDVDNLVYGFKSLTFKVKQMVLAARDWTWEKWQFVIRPWREAPVVEKPLRPRPKEGAIVVPSPPEAELAEMKGKLEQAFSDKVEVKPDVTGRAGIIKPLIKEAEAQEYLYLIVPVAEQSE